MMPTRKHSLILSDSSFIVTCNFLQRQWMRRKPQALN
jgi:hypothetical protein